MKLQALSNWVAIQTAQQLKAALLAGADELDSLGQSAIADDWRKRLECMPSKMAKESINLVLHLACSEVERIGKGEVMDPNKAWADLLGMLESPDDWEGLRDLADGLLQWLAKGGFPPELSGIPSLDGPTVRAVASVVHSLADTMIEAEAMQADAIQG